MKQSKSSNWFLVGSATELRDKRDAFGSAPVDKIDRKKIWKFFFIGIMLLGGKKEISKIEKKAVKDKNTKINVYKQQKLDMYISTSEKKINRSNLATNHPQKQK